MQIAQGVAHMIEVAEAEYRELTDAQSDPWLRFLPPSDLNKHAKQVWMLPNLTSFTSIYARMNRYYGRGLAFEVESILRHGKATPERLGSAMDLPSTPQSDYRFEEVATIEFA